MASFTLNWTPAGGLNSTGQQVQYKPAAVPTWATATSLPATDTSYLLTGLTDNKIYDIRVVNICAFGGPTPGTASQNIDLTCPTLTITPSHNSVSFSFTDLGADIDSYVVQLMNAAATSVIASKTITATGGTLSDSFTGLSASTNYNLRVTCHADIFSEQCPPTAFATTATPTCNTPVGLTVTIV